MSTLLTIYFTGLFVSLVMLLAWDLDANTNRPGLAVLLSLVWFFPVIKLLNVLYHERFKQN